MIEDDEDIPDLEEEVMRDMSSIFKNVDRTGNGVYVMASTLGALEALLAYMEECKVPVFAVNIGEGERERERENDAFLSLSLVLSPLPRLLSLSDSVSLSLSPPVL